MNFDAEGKPVLASKPTEHVCDKCGKPMVLREGPRGPFLACTGYPKCRNAKDVDAEGNPVKPIETGINCDKCGAPMVVRRGPRGPFLGCSGLSQVPQHQAGAGGAEGEAQDLDAGAGQERLSRRWRSTKPAPNAAVPMKLRPAAVAAISWVAASIPSARAPAKRRRRCWRASNPGSDLMGSEILRSLQRFEMRKHL